MSVEDQGRIPDQPCANGSLPVLTADAEPLCPVADVNGYAPPMFRAEDAEKYFSKSAGKPYRPSNGSEGDLFEGLWCAKCERDAAFRKAWEENENPPDGCEILSDVQCYAASDPEYPREWQYSTVGQPLCLAFTPLAALAKSDSPQ